MNLDITNPSNYFKEDKFHSLSVFIGHFQKRPSFINIKKKNFESTFSFKKTTSKEVIKFIRNLNIRKSCQVADIPTKVIKLNSDILANFIYKPFNLCIDRGEFLNELKHAELVPVQKKSCKCDKENYRPVSILSNFSKVYEKNIKQLTL